MQFNNVQRNTKRIKSREVGRGGKRGKTSGRGTKGQKARAGRKIRPEFRDVIMRMPKLRGYRFKPVSEKALPIKLELLEKNFSNGENVNPEVLKQKGLISTLAGRTPKIKILSDGELSKQLVISGCAVSGKAKEKIEKAGGKVA